MPSDRRFVVVIVPIFAGFPAVEATASSWAGEQGCAWKFGYVYCENDEALGWIAG